MRKLVKKMSKVVGVTIDTKSPNTKKKIYYFKTDKAYKKGDNIRIRVKTGGTPNTTIVVANSKKKFKNRIKSLEEV